MGCSHLVKLYNIMMYRTIKRQSFIYYTLNIYVYYNLKVFFLNIELNPYIYIYNITIINILVNILAWYLTETHEEHIHLLHFKKWWNCHNPLPPPHY